MIQIRRTVRDYYTCSVTHWHDDVTAACPDREAYMGLDAGELLDTVNATLAVRLSEQLTFVYEQRDDGSEY